MRSKEQIIEWLKNNGTDIGKCKCETCLEIMQWYKFAVKSFDNACHGILDGAIEDYERKHDAVHAVGENDGRKE